MAGIIKKQILKHLSRFTKNLSPDKINLSTLKGEGQLSNLELDEEVLQNMLDLPTWLAVTRVYCNKAAIRFLDKVEVEMRTCEEPRPPNGPSPIAITAGQSEYGFAEKVVEGMSVRINSITIKVHAQAFHASFELWQLQGNSLDPKWQRSDLRYTRVTDPKRGEVLTFKEINWQSLRIEADAIESDDQDLGSTPLRLITNQGRIRIALKRRIKDCNVLASKLLFILDDLLWVLTDSQLKAIIHYAKSLSEAMEKSAQQRKSMTAESLQTTPPSPGLHSLWAEPPPAPAANPNSTSQHFDLYDVKESSYHTFISRLDLHVCNDSSSLDEDEPPPPGLQGAMQLTFRKLGFDYYPVHRPADGCRHWERHSGAMESQAQWAGKLLQEYHRRVEASGLPGPHNEGPPLSRDSPAKTVQDGRSSSSSNTSDREQTSGRNGSTAPSGSSLKRLRSSCVVVRVDDVDIHQVSTRGRQNKKTQSLLSCNRKAQRLPDAGPAVHLQFTEYYFPDNPTLSVPTSNLYAQFNGLQLNVDAASVLWINLFSRGLLLTLDQVKAFYHLQDSSKAEEHVDVRVDAAQLKLIVPLDSSILDHPERPQSLCVTVPQLVLSNTRHCPHGSRADLNSVYDKFAGCSFFRPLAPCCYPRDLSAFHPVPSAFLRHSRETEPRPLDGKQLRSQDVWSLSLSRVTLGFGGARRFPKGRTQPFVEPFAASVWMCRPAACEASSSTSSPSGAQQPAPEPEEAPLASVHVLAHTITPVKLWLNHYQYVALLRMKDAMARLGAELGRDLRDVKQPSTFSLEGELSSAINVTKDATKDAFSASMDLTKGAFSITKDAFSLLSRGSGMSKLFGPQAKDQVQRSDDSSLSLASSLRHQSMKHSPSQHSFDSAILEGSLPDENLYVDSDVSDNFVILMDSESGLESTLPNNTPAGGRGSPAPGTEGGSSADLSSSLSQSIEDVLQDTSSVLLLVLSGAACTLEVKGDDQVVAAEAQSLIPVQMGNIRVSDLLAGVIPGPVQHQDRRGGGRDSPVVRLRAEAGPCAARHSALAESLGFLDVRVSDGRVDLLASTVANIGPFLEDEFSVDGQPMRLHLSNVTVTMKKDEQKVIVTVSSVVHHSAGAAATGPEDAGASCSDHQQSERRTVESQLRDAHAALDRARGDRERLLLEVRKYDPAFAL
ncbi:hypothetical protein F2P81_011072 [Scophthalmus maximus]|uniref:Uncharacterized protein n=1 Tax=Scophthalmus maximus TaxID=52904 RepID=A0A6A4SV43_SCOMX|nr:hypothetical protein F2P81_011072 [Scophthalmus maximus]